MVIAETATTAFRVVTEMEVVKTEAPVELAVVCGVRHPAAVVKQAATAVLLLCRCVSVVSLVGL